MEFKPGQVVETECGRWAYTFTCPEMGWTLKSMDVFDSAFEAKKAMREELDNLGGLTIEDVGIKSET